MPHASTHVHCPPQAIEDGLQERLSSASDYWRQVLTVSKNSPRAMVQVGLQDGTVGHGCDLELGPLNPMPHMLIHIHTHAPMQVVERMTGQVVRDLELDPLNPLSRMIPIGVLEEAGSEVRGCNVAGGWGM